MPITPFWMSLWAVLDFAMGRFGCMMGRFGQRNGPFWTIFRRYNFWGSFGRGRFGDGPFWYSPK